MCNFERACDVYKDKRAAQCDIISREVKLKYPQVDLKPKWSLPDGEGKYSLNLSP